MPPSHTAPAVTFSIGTCSLGQILIAAGGRGLSALLLGDDREELVDDLTRRFPGAELRPAKDSLADLLAAAILLVESPGAPLPDLPLDPGGTPFQRRVWAALASIPAGETASYADVAAALGAPRAARAIARACAENPIAVAIPCHRVVRKDGHLSGYRWGIARKRALLDREAGRHPHRAPVPWPGRES